MLRLLICNLPGFVVNGARVGVWHADRSEYLGLEFFHFLCVILDFMVVALRVENAMHHQMRGMLS